jgi:hypothetical protein
LNFSTQPIIWREAHGFGSMREPYPGFRRACDRSQRD